MNYFTTAAIICFYFSCQTGSAAEKINFLRKLQPGMSFFCELRAKRITVLTSKHTSQKTPDTKTTIQTANISGILLVKSITANGNADIIELKLNSVMFKNNNEYFDSGLVGETLIVDMKLKPFCGFRIKNSHKRLTSKALPFLRLLFSPSSKNTIADFIGTEQDVSTGSTWNVPLKLIQESFANNGIKLTHEDIKGNIILKGETSIKDMECWEMQENLNVTKGKDFSYKLIMTVFLPKEKAYPPIRIKKHAVTSLFQKIPSGNAMTVGLSNLKIVITENFYVDMEPVQRP